jgi:hypothetical protein
MVRTPKNETPAKAETAVAAPPVTFTPEALQAVIAQATAQAVAEATASLKAEMQAALAAKSPANNGKPDRSAENEQATVRTFKRLGIKDIQPHINVLTFRKWTEAGYRPKEGSKAVKVANLRLWHVSQVRPLSKEEIEAMKAQTTAADQRQPKSAKVVPISTGAPQ